MVEVVPLQTFHFWRWGSGRFSFTHTSDAH
jgi:hypothetical protein